MLIATVITAAVAAAVAAQPINVTGTRTNRGGARWRMVSRMEDYSVCCRASKPPKNNIELPANRSRFTV